MSQGKRKHDEELNDEPSTSSDSGPNTRKKIFVPGTYEYIDSDEENVGDFSDSGSEWEATVSEIGSYISDGNRSSIENVNTSENFANDLSIQNASITENLESAIPRPSSHCIRNIGAGPAADESSLIMNVSTADNSDLSLGEITNTSHSDSTFSTAAENNNTIKRGK